MNIFRHLQDDLTTRRGEQVNFADGALRRRVWRRAVLSDPTLGRCLWNNCLFTLSGKVVLHISLWDLNLLLTGGLANTQHVIIAAAYSPSRAGKTWCLDTVDRSVVKWINGIGRRGFQVRLAVSDISNIEKSVVKQLFSLNCEIWVDFGTSESLPCFATGEAHHKECLVPAVQRAYHLARKLGQAVQEAKRCHVQPRSIFTLHGLQRMTCFCQRQAPIAMETVADRILPALLNHAADKRSASGVYMDVKYNWPSTDAYCRPAKGFW